jgi:hypothetical protein
MKQELGHGSRHILAKLTAVDTRLVSSIKGKLK